MKEIGINLAGRLGNPSPPSPRDAEPAQKSSYGVSRLGIVAFDDAETVAPREPPAELPPEVLPPEVWDQPPREDAPTASQVDLTNDEFVWEDSPPPAAAMETTPKPARAPSRTRMKWLAVTAVIVVALAAWRVWSHVASLPREAAGQRATLAPRPPVPASPPANDPPAKSAPGPAAKTNDNIEPRTSNPPVGRQVPEPRSATPATPATPVPSGLSPGVEDRQPGPSAAPRGSDGTAGPSLMKLIGRLLAPMTATPAAGPITAPVPATPVPPPAAAPPEPAPVVSLSCPPGFLLTGIMRWADGPVAMINNRAVGVGGVVNGAKVRKISDFSVEIELKGKIYRITVAATAAPPPADDEPAEGPEDKEAAAPTSQPAEED